LYSGLLRHFKWDVYLRRAVLVLIGEVSLEIIAGAKLLASLRAFHDKNAVVAPAEELVQNRPATYISPLIRDTE